MPEGHFAADACVILMVDRYSGYKAMAQVKLGNVILVFCWAHVRRDFIEVGKGWDELKPWALTWLRRIRTLYRHQNQRLAHEPSSAEFQTADAALRQTVADMQTQAATELANPQLREPCRKTLTSLQEHWSGLTRFVATCDPDGQQRIGTGKSRPGGGTKELLRLGLSVGRPLGGNAFFAVCNRYPLRTEPTLVAQLVPGELCHSRRKGTGRHQPFLPWNLSDERRSKLGIPNTQISANNTS